MRRANQPSLFPWLLAAVLVILLPVGYMGAYYVMLESRDLAIQPGGSLMVRDMQFEVYPVYRSDDPAVANVFYPAHRIDRAIRHDYWDANSYINWFVRQPDDQ